MVYLENRSDYLNSLKQTSLKWKLACEILYNESVPITQEINEATPVATSLLRYLKIGDKENAERIYSLFAQTKPTRENSHWIYDDFVIFSLVCTVCKFKFHQSWIIDIINQTISTTDPLSRKVIESFRNLLAGNFDSNNDFYSISVVYQYLSNDVHFNPDSMNKMVVEILGNDFPSESDFINVISIKAFEIALISKGMLNPQEYYETTVFLEKFRKRTSYISKIVAYAILIASSFLIGKVIWIFNSLDSNITGFLLSIAGTGLSEVFGLTKTLRNIICKALQRGLGLKYI